MNFIFAEKKLDLSDDLRAYAEKKIGKLDRYFKSDAAVYLTTEINRGIHGLEVTVKNEGMLFRAKEKASDMYAAIDMAVSSIERQIRKNKTRLERRLKTGAFDRSLSNVVEDLGEVVEEKDFNIVKSKKFSVKPMTAEEAILQMNLLGHDFFVFRSVDDENNFSVVYRRKDGNYGLIEND